MDIQEQIDELRAIAEKGSPDFMLSADVEKLMIGSADTMEAMLKVVEAAKFAQAVLWGSDGDKKGAIKYLDKTLSDLEQDEKGQ